MDGFDPDPPDRVAPEPRKKPAQGHFGRRNDVEAEGIAQELQKYGANALHAAFSETKLAGKDSVPEDAILSLLCAHAIAPIKGANTALTALEKLAQIKGMKGSDAGVTSEAKLRKLMKELGAINDVPKGPRSTKGQTAS